MKRLFSVLSAVAIVNLLGLAGLAGYARSQHWLTRDRVLKAVEALKGEADVLAAATSMPASTDEPAGVPTGVKISRLRELDEITRTELERRAREIQDGWMLLESQQLALVQAREDLERDKTLFAETERRKAQRTGENGLKKETDILSGLKAKQAKELLRQKQDADVVVLLKTMDERKVRKIVGECKSEEERQWIGRILESIREGRAAQAEVLNAGT